MTAGAQQPPRQLLGVLDQRINLVEPAPGGQQRTWFATTPHRDMALDVVVKWSPARSWGAHLPTAVTYTETLKRRGWPGAGTYAFAHTSNGSIWVQERVGGQPVALDVGTLTQCLAFVDLQADAEEEHVRDGDNSWIDEVVFANANGWWDRTLTRLESTDRQLLVRARHFAQGARGHGNDYTLFDLNASNVLCRDGQVTGIVDTDHIGLGDRLIDAVWLATTVETRQDSWAPVEDLLAVVVEWADQHSAEQLARAACFATVSRLGWVGDRGQQVTRVSTVAEHLRLLSELATVA